MTITALIFAGRALSCVLLLGLCIVLVRDIVTGSVER